MSCLALLRMARGSHHRVLPSVYSALRLRFLCSGPKLKHLRESLRVLQLPEDNMSSHEEIKKAYLRMAKLYHPDSGTATADATLFAKVEEAYRVVLAHLAKQKAKTCYTQKQEEDEEEKLKRHAPQHRQYLSFEGVGSGTPSHRERQYQQYRMDRATEQVLEYRYKKMEKAAAEEGAMVTRDTHLRSKKIQITQAVDRLVEDLIQESMARGDFRNLSGAGKPLSKFVHNPYADPMTHNLNRILIDNGYQPEWVVIQKEIRETIENMRKQLFEVRVRLGRTMNSSEQVQWKEHCAAFSDELSKLNKKVDDFNLIVPLMSWQLVHFNTNREVEKVLKADQEHRKKKERAEKKRLIKEKECASTAPQNSGQRLIIWIRNLFM